jgi:predicted ATPase/signal transduction histidine kinase
MKKIERLAGYSIMGEIYASKHTLIYRGIRDLDQYPVTIKILRNSFPSFTELMQFRHQYEIGKDLDLPNVIETLALEPYQNSSALILEDFGGISLRSYLRQSGAFGAEPQTLITFLQIAIQIADALRGLYSHRIIHKDIKPANILINPETQQIKLIDFSISSLLPKEIQQIENANTLEGTLAYMSPEQTGRMNRGIDYRSDFYSLGITFYKLLTGELPFISDDPMELVYAHLAKQPVPVRQLKSNTPLMISQIVCKLMAKNAEDRYQNALGLKHDLEICLAQLQETGKVGLFVLGAQDPSDHFLISEKLYGRESEVAALLNAFERVSSSGNAEILLVTGYSGVGKTVVIQEVHKPIVRQRGYFIKGKYDQFQRNLPFSAFVQAFRDLMEQLLAESDLQLQTFKTQILAAVGEHGQVLIDVIPELERIIGQQPPALSLSGSAAQQRFNLLIQKFVGLFTTETRPLVLFLDDLQWADLASLDLLQTLMQDTKYLLVLGAYRDNEVSPIHPAILAINEIAKTEVTVSTITLKSLNRADLNQLIADTLNCDLDLVKPLTELVDLKTQGNPFFATQFLKALYEDGLISFDSQREHGSVSGWSCDLTKVRAASLTDDVVEFMALQLQKLSLETQSAISLGACIGSQFDLNTLAIVLERSPQDTALILWSGLQENLLIPTTNIYKFFTRSGLQSVSSGAANPVYCFLHDRVQQAAYSLIPDDRKQATHLKIGQLLQQNCSEIIKEERLFDIVGHLNRAKALVTDLSDRQIIVYLNFNAGKKARNSTAYAAANIYLQNGIELLNANCWETQYQLTLDLHVAATEAAYLSGNLERMEEIADLVLRSAQTISDKVEIYRIQIAALTANGKMLAAISVGRNALNQLGVELPITPDEAETGRTLQALAQQLEGKQIEDLFHLPVMSNRQTQKTIQLLADLAAPIFITMPGLYPILNSKMVSLSIQFGNTPASALGYVSHGLVLSTFLGDVEAGYRFGKLALKLSDCCHIQELKGRILFLFGNWIQHRHEAFHTVISTQKYGYTNCMEGGDFLNASYSISCYFDANLLCGLDLNTWEPEISAYSSALEKVKQYSIRDYLEMKRQVALNLMSRGHQSDCLIGTAYDETVMIPKHLQDSDLTALAYAYIYKLMLAYLFGNYTAALADITQADRYLQAVSGMILIPVFHFYAALTHLALCSEPSALELAEILAQVDIHQTTIYQWAQTAPMNYLHKWHLIEAEKQRVLGNRAAALEHYDQAVAGAKKHHFVQEEALANELATKFYLDWGKERIAQVYAIEAYYCYGRWGAIAKVDHLATIYPQLLVPTLNLAVENLSPSDPVEANDRETTLVYNSAHDRPKSLDLATLLKASQTISEEMKLDLIILSLLNILITNAGADRCVLLLTSAEYLQVVAKIELGQQPQLLEPISFELSTDVAISLVNKVKNSLEPIILVNTLNTINQFVGDPYIQQYQPQSILCIPIIKQGKLVGILYLENQHTIDAFTTDRLDMLKVIIAQAAISIENAKLYTELETSFTILEQKVAERTLELQAAKESADAANQAKSIFFTNMSHELRTPLNAILGMSEGLTEQVYGSLNKQQLRCIEVISNSGTHLLELIDDILDLAKIEAGKLELYCTQTNLSQLCHASLTFVKQQSLQKRIQIDINLPPDLPDLLVDERRIRQVLINLLSNAVKFTPEDGHVSVKVIQKIATGTAQQNWVQITVSDTGIGIEPENLQQLFQPFVQIDSALSRKVRGTGLGLNLVREIVELHGGKVSVSSEINVGSRFEIELPCGDLPFIFPLPTDQSSDSSAGLTTEDINITSSQTGCFSGELTPIRLPLILIADDHKANVETLYDYLEAKGYNMIVAENGQEAIEMTKLHHPDVIVMDIQMPVLDGLTAIKQLRRDPQFAKLPIIALTALAMSGDRERCLMAGANEYLTKPVTLGSLVITIQSLVP